ncbi:hypothetical protein VM1G_08653 [Cytospora mali]|uniref:Uncharacterized protein n=1 Tax=Cytospora mali TaxID=578113 RepID=A0A194W9C1_CYTMA|nr:hypothetical protein VM1G_08653 [Valsa mali]
MTIHGALEFLDPTEKTPHDMYAILTYAAAAHPDVARMVDRFARLHRDRIIKTGVEPHLVHFIPAPLPIARKRRGGRPHGSYTRPKEVIDAERLAMEARRAGWKARREAREAQKAERARKKKESLKDKDFTCLVRRAEEALGWTGKYDNEMKPKSTWSKAKKKQAWYQKAAGVRDQLMWMLKQLLKEMSNSTKSSRTGVVSIKVTYGTKRNALVAVMGISHAVLVDKTEIGMRLRENWFAGLEDTLKKAVKLLSDEELTALGKDKKLVRDCKTLMHSVPERELEGETLKEILSIVTPIPGINGGDLDNTESEKSEDEDTESSEEVGSGEELSEGQEEDEDDENRDNEDKGGDEDSEDTPDEESSEEK